VRACVRACGCSCGCMGLGLCLRACSLFYPACNAYEPYCLRLLWLHDIFQHYLINDSIFVKKLLNICILIYSTSPIWDISQCEKNSARYCHKCENVFMLRTRNSPRVSTKLEFSLQSFENSSNIRFNQNASNGSRVIYADGRTDRQTWRS
jgi:hypothetical protein